MTPHADWALPRDVRPLLEKATSLPTLRPRFAHLPVHRPISLAELPVLTKEDLGMARADLLARTKEHPVGTVVLGSGGTTGRPKLSVLPSRMFLPDMLSSWSPLTPTDVLLNCNNGGELGSMSPFYNRLAHTSGTAVVPLGIVAPEVLPGWFGFIADCGVTAIGGTPSYIATVLECYAQAGLSPPFKKIIWTGESFSPDARRLTSRVLPHADRYGVYGSTETWVVGHNGPRCGWDVFHPLPYQHVELVDSRVVVTTTHPDAVNPILRYEIGDHGEWTSCPCGRQDPGLRVLGRADQQIKFRSILFVAEEVAEVALADPDVRDAQIAIVNHGTSGERIEVRLRADDGADTSAVEQRVTKALLAELYRITYEVDDDPDAFVARVVPRLSTDHRTHKTPLLVKETA